MKILVISQCYKPESFRVTDICEALAERGHEVTVVTGLPNYPAGEIFEQSPEADTMVKGGRTRTVTFKVSLGEETNLMPNLVNQTENSAMAQLHAMEMGLKIVTEEESSDSVAAGYVVRTDPVADTELSEGQVVTIFISLGSTEMPDLKGATKENAGSILSGMGLNLKVTYLDEVSDTVEEGKVIRTEPSAKSELRKGQQVTVFISTGNGKVDVPQVVGLNVVDAINLLNENGLRYEIKRVFNESEEKDRVVSQSEVHNTQVEKNTIVILEVSDGPAPTEKPTDPPTEATEPPVEETEPPAVQPDSGEGT